MATINQRLKVLETLQDGGLKPLPLIVDEKVSDAELKRLKRSGRVVYRENDSALFDEFV